MKNVSYPTTFFDSPFADSGNRQTIPENQLLSGRASLSAGFPVETQLPLSQGGVAPNRLDFNGVLYMLSAFSFWQQSGGMWQWSDKLNYAAPSLVYSGGRLWWCLQPSGPNTDAGARAPGGGGNALYWQDFIFFLNNQSASVPYAQSIITFSQTFTVTESTYHRITCVGGGGGGAGGVGYGSFITGGGGGGGGFINSNYFKLIKGQQYSCTIGSGGAGGAGRMSAGTAENGKPGTATSFGALISASGGSGGIGGTSTSSTRIVGAPGEGGTMGDMPTYFDPDRTGIETQAVGGRGGSGFAFNNTRYGLGGAGGTGQTINIHNGLSGASGVIIIERMGVA